MTYATAPINQLAQDWHTRFEQLRIARHLLQVVNPNSSRPDRIEEHSQDFPDLEHVDLNLAGMGAPDDWEEDW